MTAAEAAPKLGLSVWTVQRKCALGKIAAVKVHGDWDISQKSIDLYIQVRRRRGANRTALELMKRGVAV